MDSKGMRPTAIVSGFHIPEHDYFSIAYDTTFDTISYYLNNEKIAEVVVTFTDANKTDILNGQRTV